MSASKVARFIRLVQTNSDLFLKGGRSVGVLCSKFFRLSEHPESSWNKTRDGGRRSGRWSRISLGGGGLRYDERTERRQTPGNGAGCSDDGPGISKHGRRLPGTTYEEAFLLILEVIFNGLPNKVTIISRIRGLPGRAAGRRMSDMAENVRCNSKLLHWNTLLLSGAESRGCNRVMN